MRPLPLLFTVFCLLLAVGILVNIGGRELAVSNGMPFWLDSFGTVFAAYLLGPVPGAAVGIVTNLIYGVVTASEASRSRL